MPTNMAGFSLLCVLVTWTVAVSAQMELFQDPDFENDHPLVAWACAGCRIELSSEHVSGNHSVKVTGRSATWSGIYQNVHLHPHTRYEVKAKVKQVNDVTGQLFQHYNLQLEVITNNGQQHFTNVAINRAITSQSGWKTITGNFILPRTDVRKTSIRLQGPDRGVSFLVDDMSLTAIPENTNWRSEADTRIEHIRKHNVTFKVNLPRNVALADMEIQVDLTKHLFGFGSQSTWQLMRNQNYDQHLYQMFNWATLSSFYWKSSPPPRERPDYSLAANALDELHRNRLNVRAHNIFWAEEDKNPDWVKSLSGSQFKQEVDRRIQYTVNQTKGRVQHWDVMNELVHNHWYEEKTGDPDFSQKIFSQLHKADSDVKLFLNEHSVVSSGSATSAYLEQAQSFKAANVGLYGLGVQCHFKEYVTPDPTLIKKNLDLLAAAGLPIWATELDVVVADEDTRADWYDIALRMLFSHPAVEGIVFWGFWHGHLWRGPYAALVSGPDFKMTAAGRKYVDLIHREWSTHVTHKMVDGEDFTIRGFHGDYEILVKYQGNIIKQQTFTLGKKEMTVNIDVTDLTHTMSTSHPPTASIQHHVVNIQEHSLGHMTSGSSNQLTCLTRYSAFSEVGDDKHTEVSCPDGYILTGCSGQIKNHRDTQDGDMIVVVGGVAKCRSYDAAKSTAPVQAVARCCKLSGLSCDYRKSGPSQNLLNQRIETKCQGNSLALGCTSHSYRQLRDGSLPSPNLTSCLAQNTDNHGGVESSAVCCSAPNLQCEVKVSGQSGGSVGDQVGVACDSGWTLVGCMSYSEDARLGGAFLGGSPTTCIAVNGGQRSGREMGVVAYATCCTAH